MIHDPLVLFLNYALAFETAYFTREWQVIEPYFTEDAVSEIQGTLFPNFSEGKEAVLEAFNNSCDQFDRRFDSREPRFVQPPALIEGGVYVKFIITFRQQGLPPLDLEGEEWDYFRGDRIARHIERFSNESEVSEFLTRYSGQLFPDP
jgi:hypothetical protein